MSEDTASNATNFNNKDYSTVCNEIRSGLTDCLGTVTWGDKGDSTFYPITFCTNNSTVGISSCCPFTYNPNTGTMCVEYINGVPASCALNSIWCCRTYNCNIAVENVFFAKYGVIPSTNVISYLIHTEDDDDIKDCDINYVLTRNVGRLMWMRDYAYSHVDTWYSMSVNGFFDYKAVTYYEVCRSTDCGDYIHKLHMANGSTYTINSGTSNHVFSLSFV